MAHECARHRPHGPRRIPERSAEIARIEQLWDECRTRFGARRVRGCSANTAWPTQCTRRWCCGCAPMARRCAKPTAAYMATVLDDAHMRDWLAAAAAESWINEASEIGREQRTITELEIVMKSWLRIADALACGFCVTASAPKARRAPSLRPTSTCWRASAIRRFRRTAATWCTCSARPISKPIAAAATCGSWTSKTRTPKPRRLTQHSANDTHPRWAVGRHQHLLPVLAHRLTADLATAADRRRGRADHRLSARRDHLPFFARRRAHRAQHGSVSGLRRSRSARGTGSTRLRRARRPAASSTACSCATGIPGATARARTCSWRR